MENSIKIIDLISYLESYAPPFYQESYDNSGLITGNREKVVSSALITLDVTEKVIDEAIEKNCGLIISHHPIVFKPLKRITGDNYVERCLLKAIKNDIAIYSCHTNFDSITGGVNSKIGEKIGLTKMQILSPAKDQLYKLVTFVPEDHLNNVRESVFKAGAGHIGRYDKCSYNISGSGTFRGGDETNPFLGTKGEFSIEKEIRFETILPRHLKQAVIRALLETHPYEEVAYDIYPLENEFSSVGPGMIGELLNPVNELEFLSRLLEIFKIKVIRHTPLLNKKIQKVAICGGSGSFLLHRSVALGADIFLTADLKYHDFFDADRKLIIADIGHYESEQFTKELFYEILIKKFSNFALRLSETETNPISYLVKDSN